MSLCGDTIKITLPMLNNVLPKSLSCKSKRLPRLNEQFKSDFNLFTYFNTKPIIPIKYIEKQRNESGTESWPPFPTKIESIYRNILVSAKKIQIISGLNKNDSFDLLFKINNHYWFINQQCRIVYLQSLSIMTFWMALKAKDISNCGNSVGYQITLESKYVFLKKMC